jgi:PAS domain S-box-containing protein
VNSDSVPVTPDDVQARLAAIVATSDDAIISKNLDGIIQSWNHSAERIFGYTAEEMIGKPLATLIPADRQHEEVDILSRIRRGERVDHYQTIRQRKDGRLIDVSVTISPIRDPSGRIIGASKIARDITDLKRAAREREQLLQSEQAARQEAERVSRMKDEFLATLSHELRTPLNAILGWSQLLRITNTAPEDMRQGLETIERNARVQTQLIEELLDMSRIISGKVRLDVQRVDLAQVIGNACEAVQLAADAKNIQLLRVIDSAAATITGDPGRMQQVIWNLLSNAIKFTPRGGHVKVALQRGDGSVELSVIDDGQGIDPQFLPRLFERFSQADSSTTRQHGGLGLGLAIVRHLVELHGGSIRALSEGQDKGSAFTVSLPVSAATDERLSMQPSLDRGSMAGPLMDLSGVTVMIVDDELDARELVRRVLEASRATVMMAESSEEAMELIQRDRPDVLLTDIGMPGEDGYRLLERVREMDRNRGTEMPVAAVTAFARSEDRRRAMVAGFRMHLPKPVDAAELIAVVASLAGLNRRAPQSD